VHFGFFIFPLFDEVEVDAWVVIFLFPFFGNFSFN
jgi:hypothetical protein